MSSIKLIALLGECAEYSSVLLSDFVVVAIELDSESFCIFRTVILNDSGKVYSLCPPLLSRELSLDDGEIVVDDIIHTDSVDEGIGGRCVRRL